MKNQFDLPPETVEKLRHTFASFPQVEKAVLFGSRAKGTSKPGSDIDLVLFGPDLDSRTLDRIEIAVDDLMLPYRVDLLIHHRITHPELLKHIERVGAVFYEQSVFSAEGQL